MVARPPFTGLIALRVETGAACEHLRNSPSGEAASLECLPTGAVVDSVAPPDETHYHPLETTGHLVGGWVHVRAPDGVQGWMDLAGLVWTGDPLESRARRQ